MQQAMLVEPGRIEFRDISIPEPGAGEVVIRIHSALTCGTDLKAFQRGHALIPMPGPFGHEYSGTIAATGKGVNEFSEGDAVMGVHSAPCMECSYCRRRLYNLCMHIMNSKALGAFSDYMLLPAHVVRLNLFHKPADLDFSNAALLEPLSCVIHPYSRLNMNDIQNALVIGAGPIGLMHVVYMKSKGLKVMTTDISVEKLGIAEKLGAIIVDKENVEQVIMQATNDLGTDLIIECTGQKHVWEQSVNYARRGGSIMLFGGCPSGTAVTYDTHRLHYDELTLSGSFHYTPDDVKTAFTLLAERKVDLSMLISGEFRLNELETAFSLLKEGKGIKYSLRP